MSLSYSYGTWTFTWPYPRLFVTDFYVLALAPADWLDVIGETPAGSDNDLVLFELICDGSAWTAYPVHNLGLSASVDQVKIAGFGPFYIACSFDESAESVVSVARKFTATSTSSPTYQFSHRFEGLGVPPAVAACNFKGQVVLAGLNSNIQPWNDLGLCSAAWAAPGTMEFNPDVNRGAGFAKLPLDDYGKGYVYDVRRLGDRVIAYGNLGVCGLKPFSNDKVTGFGVEEDYPYPGLNSGNQIDGDYRVHAYISNENELWIVQGDRDFKMLGYKEFLETLSDPIVTYVKQKELFYISDSSKCYVLTKYGMYECHQLVSGAGIYRGTLCGFFDDTEDYEWRIGSTPVDFGLRALKFLEVMEIGGSYAGQPELVGNGNMEADSGWDDMSFPSFHEQVSDQKHSGSYSRKFTSADAGDGLGCYNNRFSLVAGIEYVAEAWIYSAHTAVDLRIYKASGAGTDVTQTMPVVPYQWTKIEKTFTSSTTGSQAYIAIVSPSAIPVGTWYVDDVSVKRNLDTYLYGRVGYKYNYDDKSFSNAPWILADRRGVLFPRITANEFILWLKGSEYRGAFLDIDYINCGIKLVDKHGIRRAYGNISKSVSRTD